MALSQPMPVSVIRALRLATKLPQAEFAKRLGVSKETYRAWDSNRRQPSSKLLDKARALAARGSRDQPLGLPTLAKILRVSVYRLRDAARDGRLAVTYDNRIVFGTVAESHTGGRGSLQGRVLRQEGALDAPARNAARAANCAAGLRSTTCPAPAPARTLSGAVRPARRRCEQSGDLSMGIEEAKSVRDTVAPRRCATRFARGGPISSSGHRTLNVRRTQMRGYVGAGTAYDRLACPGRYGGR